LRARIKTTFDQRGIAFAYAGSPTQVIVTQEPPQRPTPPTTSTKANMPPSDGLGVGGEGRDDVGTGADGDAD